MRGNKGRIVSFLTREKKTQYGIAYVKDQNKTFEQSKKVFVRYIGDDYLPMKDKDGKEIVGLKDSIELSTIGFVD